MKPTRDLARSQSSTLGGTSTALGTLPGGQTFGVAALYLDVSYD